MKIILKVTICSLFLIFNNSLSSPVKTESSSIAQDIKNYNLIEAIFNVNISSAKFWISSGADVNSKVFINQNYYNTLRALLTVQNKYSSTDFQNLIFWIAKNNITCCQCSINHKNLSFFINSFDYLEDNYKKKLIELYLKLGYDINQIIDNRKTILHAIITNSNKKLIEWLISQEANVNVEDKYEVTPIYYAVFESKLEIVKLLLEYGAKIKRLSLENCLIQIAERLTEFDSSGNEYTKVNSYKILILLKVVSQIDFFIRHEKSLSNLIEQFKYPGSEAYGIVASRNNINNIWLKEQLSDYEYYIYNMPDIDQFLVLLLKRVLLKLKYFDLKEFYRLDLNRDFSLNLRSNNKDVFQIIQFLKELIKYGLPNLELRDLKHIALNKKNVNFENNSQFTRIYANIKNKNLATLLQYIRLYSYLTYKLRNSSKLNLDISSLIVSYLDPNDISQILNNTTYTNSNNKIFKFFKAVKNIFLKSNRIRCE